ncbi:hypothetical protein HYT56_05045 [Candidatus Woesearchaeota archaeon]|nr:hypothetical protein [Candidatus Woesearchaeota archaeon]
MPTIIELINQFGHYSEEKGGILQQIYIASTDLGQYNYRIYQEEKNHILSIIREQLEIIGNLNDSLNMKKINKMDVGRIISFFTKLKLKEKERQYTPNNYSVFSEITTVLIKLARDPEFNPRNVPREYFQSLKRLFPSFFKSETESIGEIKEYVVNLSNNCSNQKRTLTRIKDPARMFSEANEKGIEDLERIKRIFHSELKTNREICAELMNSCKYETEILQSIRSVYNLNNISLIDQLMTEVLAVRIKAV